MNPESCRSLVETHFPQVQIHTCEPIDMGWDYFVLDVNDSLIFRFPRRTDVLKQLEWEMEILPMLADVLPVQVPRVEYVAMPDWGEPSKFVGYKKIRGSGLEARKLEKSGARGPVARGIGGALSALHSMPLDGLNDHPMSQNPEPRNVEGWRNTYRRLFQFAQENVFPRLSHQTARREVKTWQDFLDDDSNFNFSPVLIHRDLNTEHLITDYESGTVVGIIDWGDCGFGDPALDFVGLARGLGEGFSFEVLEHYQHPDPGIMRRARFYDALVPYHYIKFELESGDTGFLERGVRDIETREPYRWFRGD